MISLELSFLLLLILLNQVSGRLIIHREGSRAAKV